MVINDIYLESWDWGDDMACAMSSGTLTFADNGPLKPNLLLRKTMLPFLVYASIKQVVVAQSGLCWECKWWARGLEKYPN